MQHVHGNLRIKITFFIHEILQKILLIGLKFFYSKINLKTNRVLISKATSADWIVDKQYLNIFKKIKNLTLLDHPRLYSLYNFSLQRTNIDADILDIGTLMGGAGITMSKVNSKGKVFLIDTFAGYAQKMDNYNSSIFNYDNIDELKLNIRKNNCKNTFIFKDNFPLNAHKLSIKKIKIAHIDVNLHMPTKKIFDFVDNKIIKNGIIIFDDYGIYGVEKLTNFLRNLIQKKKILKKYIYFQNYFGQLVLIRK